VVTPTMAATSRRKRLVLIAVDLGELGEKFGQVLM
jgi:hypothetical protein